MAHPAAGLVRQTLVQYLSTLGANVVQHGGHLALAKDVLVAAVPLLRSSASRDVDRLLSTEQLDAAALSSLLSSSLSTRRVGSQMDRSLHVLRQATQRNDFLQQLSNSSHTSCTSSTGIAVTAESHLAEQPAAANTWRFQYAVTLKNDGAEPVQVLRRSWKVLDLCGRIRCRTSLGIQGLQPVIEAGNSFTYSAPITLCSFKGGVEGAFDLVALSSKSSLVAQLPPLGLTLSHEQYAQLQPSTSLMAAAAEPPLNHQQPSEAGLAHTAAVGGELAGHLPLQQTSSSSPFAQQ